MIRYFAFIVQIVFCLNYLEASVVSAEPPLTWLRCMELGVQNNPDLKMAETQLEGLEGTVLVQKSKFLPNVNASLITLPPTLSFNFRQTAYSKAMTPTSRMIEYERSAAWANFELTLVELVYKLRSAFSRALFTRELISLYREESGILEDRLRRAPSMFDAGLLKRADVSSLKVRVSLSHEKVSRSEADLEKARLELAEIMGIPPNHPAIGYGIADSFDTTIPAVLDVQELTKKATEHRPDLQVLRNLQLAAGQKIEIVQASSYPELIAFGDFNLQGNAPGLLQPLTDKRGDRRDENLQFINNSRVAMGGNISWRIFDGGLTLGQVRVAQAEEIQKKVLIKKIENEIPGQITAAVTAMKKISKLWEEFSRASAPQNIEIVQKAFETGQISQLEILSVEEQIISYKQGKLNLLYNLELARATLDRITGQGVSILRERP